MFEKFAKKFFEEAIRDLERARRALRFEDYPQSAFYAQQCVEKCVKAMLEARKRAVYNHGLELIAIFTDATSGRPDHSVALSSQCRIVGYAR